MKKRVGEKFIFSKKNYKQLVYSRIIIIKIKKELNFSRSKRRAKDLWDLTVLTEIFNSDATSSYFLPSM